jgi:hypothetical protein
MIRWPDRRDAGRARSIDFTRYPAPVPLMRRRGAGACSIDCVPFGLSGGFSRVSLKNMLVPLQFDEALLT